MLADQSVRDLLTAFSASEPTPGGGSASALASAVGASLLLMVCGLQKTRRNSDEDRAALERAAGALVDVRLRLTEAIDEDTRAYDDVVAAYRLPKGTAEEQASRKAAVQRALRRATDVPLGVVRLSAKALELACDVAAHGYQSAASDVGVAIALLRAGVTGAKLNVGINLDSVKDAPYVDAIRTELQALVHDAESAATNAQHALSAA